MSGTMGAILAGLLFWAVPEAPREEEGPESKILELIQRKIERANLQVGRAVGFLGEGKTAEARSALQEAQTSLEDLKRANDFLEDVLQKPDDPLMQGISIVRVRIKDVAVGPDFIVEKGQKVIRDQEKSEIPPKARRFLQAWKLLLATASALPKWEEVDAEVIEVHTAGSTMRGLLRGARPRRDLVAGRTLKLERGRDPGRPLTVGKEYWMVIGVLASHRMPFLLLGGGTRSHVYIDEPAEEATEDTAPSESG